MVRIFEDIFRLAEKERKIVKNFALVQLQNVQFRSEIRGIALMDKNMILKAVIDDFK